MKRDERERPCAVIGPASVAAVAAAAAPAWPPPHRRPPAGNISPRRTFQENMSRIVIPSPGAAKQQPDMYDVRYCEGPALVSQHQQPQIQSNPHVQPHLQPHVQAHVQAHVQTHVQTHVQAHVQPRIQPAGQPQQQAQLQLLLPQSQPQPQFDPRYASRPQRFIAQEYPASAFDYRSQPQPYRPEQYQFVRTDAHYPKPPERQTYDCAFPFSQPDKYQHPPAYEYSYPYAERHRPNPPQLYYREACKRPTAPAPDPQQYRYRYVRTTPPPELDRRPKCRPQPGTAYPQFDPSSQTIPAQFDPYAKIDRTAAYARRPPYAAVVETGAPKMEYYDPYRTAPPDGYQYPTPETPRAPTYFNVACDYGSKRADCHYADGTYAPRPAYERTWETAERPKFQYETKYPIHNPLARIPTEFSPNVISPNLSPAAPSKLAFQPQPYRENVVRYEQFMRPVVENLQLQRKDRRYESVYERSRPLQSGAVESSTLHAQSAPENRSEKPTLDLKHYLENWNEEYEDPKGAAETHIINETLQNDGNAQLYVFDKFVIPEEELVNYKHVQKISKLPDFIKDVTKETPKMSTGTCNILENKIIAPAKVQKGRLQMPITDAPKAKVPKLDYFADELIDVEAKISQSVIHKEVGCNFEIKPCSPDNGVRVHVSDRDKLKLKNEPRETKNLTFNRLQEKRNPNLNNSPSAPTLKCQNEKNADRCPPINQSNKVNAADSVLCKNVEVISYSDSMMEYERKINRESRICGSVFSSTNDNLRIFTNKDVTPNKPAEILKNACHETNAASKIFCNSLPDFSDMNENGNNINLKEFAHIENVMEDNKKLDEAFPNLSVSNDDQIGVILNMGNANSLHFDDKSILPISEYFEDTVQTSASEEYVLQESTFDKSISSEMMNTTVLIPPLNNLKKGLNNENTTLDTLDIKNEDAKQDFPIDVTNDHADIPINMISNPDIKGTNMGNESVLLINPIVEVDKSADNQCVLKDNGLELLDRLDIEKNFNLNMPRECNISPIETLPPLPEKKNFVSLERYANESKIKLNLTESIFENDVSDQIKMGYNVDNRNVNQLDINSKGINTEDTPLECDIKKSSTDSLENVPKKDTLPHKNRNVHGKIFFSKKLNRFEYSTDIYDNDENERLKSPDNLTSAEELQKSNQMEYKNPFLSSNLKKPIDKEEKINDVCISESVIIAPHEKNHSLFLIEKETDGKPLAHDASAEDYDDDDVPSANINLNCNTEKLFEIDISPPSDENTNLNCENILLNKLEPPKINADVKIIDFKSDCESNEITISSHLNIEVPISSDKNKIVHIGPDLNNEETISSEINNEVSLLSNLNKEMSVSSDLNTEMDMDDEMLNLETGNEMDSMDNREETSDSLEKGQNELYASGKMSSKNLDKHYQGYLMEDSLSDDDYPTCTSVMLCGEQNSDMSSGEESESSHSRDKLDTSNLDVNGLEIGGCWIDDIACVETVIAEENNNNKTPESEDSREMWKVTGGKKYFSPFVDYKKESNDILKDSNSNVISEFNEKFEYDESKQHSETSNYSISPKSESSYNTDSQMIESADDLKSAQNTEHENLLNDSYKRIYAELESQFGSPETDSEPTIKDESDQRKKSRIKKSSRSSSVSSASIHSTKIKTKGAKKYIPPMKDSHKKLKCHLPIPENMLLSLKKTNSIPNKNEEEKISRSVNRMVLPKKPPKPLFEDVLKNIDETQITLLEKKLKKTKNLKKAIPKMIIRKNEQGSHYTSVPKKDVQKSKADEWQPQVCLERSACIEDLIKDKNVVC